MQVPNICRCCLTKDCYKDLSNEYFWGGVKEVYGDILSETFSINISHLEGCKRLICENCITKLREATVFRKQVIQAEDTLVKELVSVNKSINTAPDDEPSFDADFDCEDNTETHTAGDIKSEVLDTLSDDFVDKIDDGVEFDDDPKGQIFIIKLEPKQEEQISSAKTKCITRKKVDKKPVKRSARKTVNIRKKSKKMECEERDNIGIKSQSDNDLKENSIKLITNSNMCMFRSLKTKFGCFFCKLSFRTIAELRQHVTKSSCQPAKLKINRFKVSFKNVDISSLTCNICSKEIEDINELRTHLTTKHEIEFADAEHMLVPYKLDKDFQCVICAIKFNSYMRLSIHMNTHSTNNVCEICGVSYINRLSLRTHINSQHKEHKCTVCNTKFITLNLKVKHMRKVHNKSTSKRYCLECNETFRYTYLLEEHRIKVHGLKRKICVCNECGKTFINPAYLKVHVRSVHMKERNYPCTFCEMRFFTKFDQKRHERTHEDERLFACNYCDVKFKSKDSLRRHLKRLHGHIGQVLDRLSNDSYMSTDS